jgi:N-acetylglucosamine kinase-like BadF-type ATPase
MREAVAAAITNSHSDYLLTDQGSGYSIGRRVLRYAVKSYDGRMEKSIMEELVKEHFHITSIADLKDAVYNPPLNKPEVAELTKICVQAFDQGDAVARETFDYAVDELYLMIETVMVRLGITGRPIDCVLVGGITKIQYIYDRLEGKLKTLCPQVTVVRPQMDPVHGALRLALG